MSDDDVKPYEGVAELVHDFDLALREWTGQQVAAGSQAEMDACLLRGAFDTAVLSMVSEATVKLGHEFQDYFVALIDREQAKRKEAWNAK